MKLCQINVSSNQVRWEYTLIVGSLMPPPIECLRGAALPSCSLNLTIKKTTDLIVSKLKHVRATP